MLRREWLRWRRRRRCWSLSLLLPEQRMAAAGYALQSVHNALTLEADSQLIGQTSHEQAGELHGAGGNAQVLSGEHAGKAASQAVRLYSGAQQRRVAVAQQAQHGLQAGQADGLAGRVGEGIKQGGQQRGDQATGKLAAFGQQLGAGVPTGRGRG